MYIEYLSFYNIIFLIYNFFIKKINLRHKTIFYIDRTFCSIIIGKILNYLFKVKFQYLNFKMMDIKDQNNKLIRLRIFTKDLKELRKKIIKNHDIFNEIKKNTNFSHFYSYLFKKLASGHMAMEPETLVRAVFLIQVVLWHSKKNNFSNVSLYIGNRSWFEELKEYARKYNIKLYKTPQLRKHRERKNFYFFHIGQNNFPLLFNIYNIVRQIIRFNYPFAKYNINDLKIYHFTFNQFNLNNDGHKSDFFYVLNSNLEAKNVIYDCANKNINELELKNFSASNKKLVFSKNIFLPRKKFLFGKKGLSNLEYNFFVKNLKNYNLIQRRTNIFSRINNIKIYLTWNKYTEDHIAQHEVISTLGGIYAIWQFSFEGSSFSSTQMSTDLYFSCFSEKFFFMNNSKIKYYINTGYLMDYQYALLKEEAQFVRNKILSNGAKYIVAIFDENSSPDKRWHTGNLLQAENYEIILKELLINPNLGVIFKPKFAKNLRERIGTVNKLLVEAVNTGRCYIYENSGHENSDYGYSYARTSAPPVLAGMSADICIHSHLSAGSAALECALANLPTILIDREGTPDNLFYDILDKNIIFKNWEEAIYAINDIMRSKTRNHNFGKWPNHFLNSIDKFRDGKAAFRMGEYLNTLINLIKENKSRDEVMAVAAEIYTKKYGIDKIITIN